MIRYMILVAAAVLLSACGSSSAAEPSSGPKALSSDDESALLIAGSAAAREALSQATDGTGNEYEVRDTVEDVLRILEKAPCADDGFGETVRENVRSVAESWETLGLSAEAVEAQQLLADSPKCS